MTEKTKTKRKRKRRRKRKRKQKKKVTTCVFRLKNWFSEVVLRMGLIWFFAATLLHLR